MISPRPSQFSWRSHSWPGAESRRTRIAVAVEFVAPASRPLFAVEFVAPASRRLFAVELVLNWSGAACESRYSAIHPDNPPCRSEVLVPLQFSTRIPPPAGFPGPRFKLAQIYSKYTVATIHPYAPRGHSERFP